MGFGVVLDGIYVGHEDLGGGVIDDFLKGILSRINALESEIEKLKSGLGSDENKNTNPSVMSLCNSDELIYAAKNGDTTSVKALLLNNPGINVNAKNKHGETALMWAASQDHVYIVDALLKHPDIAVNATDKNGWTALIFAAWNGHIESVEALLKHHDIDVNVKNDGGRTALRSAVLHGHTEIIKMLMKAGAV